MHIKNINTASILSAQLKELEEQYLIIVRGQGLGITIQSRYQDDAFVDAVRSSVTGELSRRIGAINGQLKDLGITSFGKQ